MLLFSLFVLNVQVILMYIRPLGITLLYCAEKAFYWLPQEKPVGKRAL